VRFKRIVRPGDVLDLECEISRLRGPIGKAAASAHVGGELACRAQLTFALTDLEASA
jgi:3-hydroxyacyl-[acyl-carrier-protein] dehydratase